VVFFPNPLTWLATSIVLLHYYVLSMVVNYSGKYGMCDPCGAVCSAHQVYCHWCICSTAPKMQGIFLAQGGGIPDRVGWGGGVLVWERADILQPHNL